MKANESVLDRVIRFVAGLGILSYAFSAGDGWLLLVLYVTGIFLVVTGLTGFSAFYELLGYSSRKSDEVKENESLNPEKGEDD